MMTEMYYKKMKNLLKDSHNKDRKSESKLYEFL